MPRRFALAAVVAGLLSPVAALAHLYWPTYHSARSAVSLGADGLEVAVVLEIPTFRLVADFKQHYADVDLMAEIEAGRFEKLENDYRDFLFEELAATLDLEIDGAEAAGRWRPVDTPVNGKGTEGFFVYLFEFAFDREPEAGDELRVRVLTRAFEGEEVVMANQAEAADGWAVTESSIPPREEYELPAGAELEDPELGLWSIDPVKRDLRVTFSRVDRDAGRPRE
ncbi:MAG: hypothetical protein R3190_16830 [Thermoanaerobaculia bacterium]|nr:hypothetical protein [Thermoanaerobaculia bacterium]